MSVELFTSYVDSIYLALKRSEDNKAREERKLPPVGEAHFAIYQETEKLLEGKEYNKELLENFRQRAMEDVELDKLAQEVINFESHKEK